MDLPACASIEGSFGELIAAVSVFEVATLRHSNACLGGSRTHSRKCAPSFLLQGWWLLLSRWLRSECWCGISSKSSSEPFIVKIPFFLYPSTFYWRLCCTPNPNCLHQRHMSLVVHPHKLKKISCPSLIWSNSELTLAPWLVSISWPLICAVSCANFLYWAVADRTLAFSMCFEAVTYWSSFVAICSDSKSIHL